MKKTILLSATALLACVACNKEITEPAAPAETVITAYTPGSETRAAVAGLQVQWTTGDQVALFNTDGTPKTFTLVGDGPVSSGTFSSSESGINPSGLAAFPAADASVSGKKISIKVPATIPYGTSPIPMVGKATSLTSFSFALTTGAICITFKELPLYPSPYLVIRAAKNITGTLEIPNYDAPTTGVAFASEGAGNMFTVTGIPTGASEVTVTLPLPAGTYTIDTALLAADGQTSIPRSIRHIENLTITAGGIAKMKPVMLESESSAAPMALTTSRTALALSSIPGTWQVNGNNGYKVLGGGGGDNYPAIVNVYEKSWAWSANNTNSSYKREADNTLTISVTSMSPIAGTVNWDPGVDGEYWDYTWRFYNPDKPEYVPFFNTDLSGYYDKIPKGESNFSMAMENGAYYITFSNGVKARLLMPGIYTFMQGRTLDIPEGCFALKFHLGNLKPLTKPSSNTMNWDTKDIDRFLFCPLEYFIIFKKP